MVSLRRALIAFAAMAFIPVAVTSQSTDARVAPNDEVRRILVERIDTAQQGVGIVVGVIEPGGRRIVTHGKLARDDGRSLDGDTVFEIGSITKVFTALLLADAVQRKAVALSDPVAKFLPAEVRMPGRGNRAITLEDLATHTSGLPRLPENMSPKDASNPYADYSVDALYQFLSGYQLTRDIGQQYEYSNLGGGLLGHGDKGDPAADWHAGPRQRERAGVAQRRHGRLSDLHRLRREGAHGHRCVVERRDADRT